MRGLVLDCGQKRFKFFFCPRSIVTPYRTRPMSATDQERGWREVRHRPLDLNMTYPDSEDVRQVPPTNAGVASTSSVVVVDDDDDVQVCSPRSFAQAKCQRDHTEDDPLQLRLGPTGAKPRMSRKRTGSHLSKGRQHRQKRVLPTIDLTSTTNEDCEVIYEKTQKKSETTAQPLQPSKEINLTCAICYDTMKNETSTVCGHIFCANCILSAIKVQKRCPTCRRKLTNSMVHRIYLCGST